MLQSFLFVFLIHAENIFSPGVQKMMAQKTPAMDVIVYFERTSDLSQAKNRIHRAQRIEYVFQSLVQQATHSQKDLQKWLVGKNKNFRSFYIENAVAIYAADAKTLREIAQMKGIQSIGLNAPIRMKEVPLSSPQQVPGRALAGHLSLIQVDKVWSQLGVKGAGIVVAGQDTGFYWQHNALRSKYRGVNGATVSHNYNWHDAIHGTKSGFCSADEVEPCDDKDHGTHTMGTMVGDDGKGRQIGVAPEAQWIGCRNMKKGVGTVASYLECFEFFLAPYPLGGDPQKDGRPDLAPHIVNNSWSCPVDEGCKGDEFLGVIEAYKAAGILLVVAASNNGPNCGTVSDAPAKYAGEVLSVGAYNTYMNDIAFFSALGPSTWKGQLAPNLIAPGDVIVSAVTKGPDSYEDKLGTSMSSPQVAGAAALLWSHRPELIGQIEATIDILQKSARGMTANSSCAGFPAQKIPNAVHGYGMLDAYKALTTP
jgi:subtilisin family serine protease